MLMSTEQQILDVSDLDQPCSIHRQSSILIPFEFVFNRHASNNHIQSERPDVYPITSNYMCFASAACKTVVVVIQPAIFLIGLMLLLQQIQGIQLTK